LPFVRASHEDPKFPGVLKKVLLRADDFVVGKVQMVNWALLAPGRSFKRHYHEDMQEVFIIIRGDARITVGGREARIGPGDVVVIPVGDIHTMENIGEEAVEYIVVGISEEKGGKTVVV
jgi:mannose-6-phosphate isomerase-like protein (cupin superfamily)